MKAWSRCSYEQTLLNGKVQKVYKLTFETDDKEILKQVENFFYTIMDQKAVNDNDS